jgi:hypothetical protein
MRDLRSGGSKGTGSGGDFHSVRTVPVDDDEEPIISGGITGGLYFRSSHGMMTPFHGIKIYLIDSFVDRIVAAESEIVRDRSPILGVAYFSV